MEPKQDSGEFLYNFSFVLFKRKWSILVVFLITFAGVILGTFLLTPLWKATAKVQVDINPKQQLALFKSTEATAPINTVVTPANNFIQLLTTRWMAERLVKKFHRDEMYRKRVEEPTHPRDKMIAYFREMLIEKPLSLLAGLGIITLRSKNYLAETVKELLDDLEDIDLEEDTGIINITIWAEDNKMAADMVNTMVDLLVETDLRLTNTPIEQLYNFTKEQLVKVYQDVRQLEDKIQKFMKKHQIVLLDTQKKALIYRLDEYKNDLIQTRSSQKEISEQINEVKNQLAEQEPEKIIAKQDKEKISTILMADNPQVLDLKSILRKLKGDLAALLVEKRPEHLDVIRLQKEINLYEMQLEREKEKTVQSETKVDKTVQTETKSLNPFYYDLTSKFNSLKLDKSNLATKENGIINAIKKVEKELLGIPEKELHLTRLNDQLSIKKKIHDELKNRSEELNVIRKSPFSDYHLKVIEKAVVYDNVPPDRPKWVFNFPIGFFASIFLGVGFAFFLEYWDSSFKSVKELEEELNLPVLGALPRYR